MFNPDFTTFYSDRFDFVRFNDQNEIEYLNGKGELMGKCTLEVDANKVYKIKEDPLFKGFEIIDARQINLVSEMKYHQSGVYQGKKDGRLNLRKLIPAKMEIDQEEFSKIQTNSEWELIQQKGKRDAFRKFTLWKETPKDVKENAFKDIREYRKHKSSSHLIKIEDAIIIVRQTLDSVQSKEIVSKITDKEITLVNHVGDYEEYILKRIN